MADRSLMAILGANVTGFVAGMGTAKQSAIDFNRSVVSEFGKNRAAIDTVSNSALKMGAAMTAAAGFAVKSAMDWETAWTGVLKTVDGTPAQLAAVEQGLRDLATSMPESHKDIAAVAEAAGQLGVATADIVGFTETMVMLGDTTNLTSQEAATSIAQFMNIMGTAAGDVDNLGAALVALGNRGASTEAEIIDMAQRIAGAGRVAGLTEANVLALSNAIASTGIQAELGGTAMSQVLSTITKAVATNSAELEVWAQVSGMTAQQFAQAWEDDPTRVITDFSRGLDEMGKEAFAVFGELGLDGQRVAQVLLNLAGSNDKVAQSFRDGNVEWARNAALVAEAEKRYDTAAARMEISWNKVKDAGIDAGQGLLPVVAGMVEGIGDLAAAFGSLPEGVQSIITALAGFSGVALLGVGAVGKLTAAYAANRLAMIELQATAPATAAAVGRLGTALKVVAVATAAFYALNKLGTIGQEEVPKVNEYTKALLGAADGSEKARASLERLTTNRSVFKVWQADLEGLKETFQGESAISGFIEPLIDWFPGVTSTIEQAARSIEQIDKALQGMVNSGAADQAARSLDYLQRVTGKSENALLKDLPLYAEALDRVGTEAARNEAAFMEMAGGSEAAAMKLAELAPTAEEAAQIQGELQKATQEASLSFLDLAADLDQISGGFDQWLADLEKSAQAADEWANNLIKAAARGLPEGMLRELEAAGPQAAALLAEIADSTDEELARIIDAWARTSTPIAEVINRLGQPIIMAFDVEGEENAIQAAVDVAMKFGVVPRDVRTILKALDWATEDIDAVIALMKKYEKLNPTTTVDADTSRAESKIGGLIDLLDDLISKSNEADGVGVGTVLRRDARGGAVEYAAGGSVTGYGWGGRARGAIRGPGSATSDSIPAMLSNGEHVLTASDVNRLGGQQAVYDLRAAIQSGVFAARMPLGSGGAGGSFTNVDMTIHVQAAPGMDTNQLASAVVEKAMFKLGAAGVRT